MTETTQLSLFDYQSLDVETRIVVRQRKDEINNLARRAAQDIIEIGRKLSEVQDRLPGKKFDEWLKCEFAWSRRTAFNFISVSQQFGDANFALGKIAPSALYLLAAPSTPKEAREEALNRAESGEKITHSEAKAIVESHTPQFNWGDRVIHKTMAAAIVKNGDKNVAIEYEKDGKEKKVKLTELEPHPDKSYPPGDLKQGDQIWVNGESARYFYPIGLNHSIVYFEETVLNEGTGTKKREIGGRISCTHRVPNSEIQKQLDITPCEPSNSTTSAPAMESDSPSPEFLPSELNSSSPLIKTPNVETSSPSDTPTLKSGTTSTKLTGQSEENADESTFSPPPPPANLSVSKVNEEEATTPATVFPQSSALLSTSDPSTSSSKTSPDSLTALSSPESLKDLTSSNSSIDFPRSGLMANGKLSPVESSGVRFSEKDYYLLPSPGAMSNLDGNKPPGQMLLEGHLKSLEVLASKECLNPSYLEKAFSLPLNWTNPSESRPAIELLGSVEKPWGIALIRELLSAPSIESSGLTTISENNVAIGDRVKVPEIPGLFGTVLEIDENGCGKVKWDKGEITWIAIDGLERFDPFDGKSPSDSAEHYTPKPILDLVVQVLGAIDLDPCSNAGKNVPAKRHYTKEDDGLRQSWQAETIFLNPPYGREIDKWVSRLVHAYESKSYKEAIALVPARTDTTWFDRFYGHNVCFWRGRITFLNNDDPAKFPSAFFYLGENPEKFSKVFRSHGSIYKGV